MSEQQSASQPLGAVTPTRRHKRQQEGKNASPTKSAQKSKPAVDDEGKRIGSEITDTPKSKRTASMLRTSADTSEAAAAVPVTPRQDQVKRSRISPKKQDLTEDSTILLKHAYRIISKQRGHAYGTPFSPIYGENTQTSLSRAFALMGLGTTPNAIYCDVGSGSGVTCFHAACEFPQLTCYGFELMGSRWWISQSILLNLLQDDRTSEAAQRTLLAHIDLLYLQDFGPCTHVFSFDVGFPKDALKAFGRALNDSHYVRVVASFQKPNVLEEADFKDLELKGSLSMKQVGSGESRTVYIYHINRTILERTTSSSRSWNLTGLYPPPSRSEYQPNVPHTAAYAEGATRRLQGREAYISYVRECVGLDRTSGVQTRRGMRHAIASDMT